jgi:hypothetical protein
MTKDFTDTERQNTDDVLAGAKFLIAHTKKERATVWLP